MVEKQFIEILKSEDVNSAINFISDHYMEFSKEQLKELARELLFGAREDPEVLSCAGEELENDWRYYFVE